jgi:hypothetical protein
VEIHGSASKLSIRARKEPYTKLQQPSKWEAWVLDAPAMQFGKWNFWYQVGILLDAWEFIYFFFRPTQNKRNSYTLTNEPLQVCLQVCLLDHKQMVTVTFICWIGILLLKHKASVKCKGFQSNP